MRSAPWSPAAAPHSPAAFSLDPVDVVIFAPHPDDEVIGCGGVIQQALAAGKRVRVVFSTNGDGYPRAASALLRKPERDVTPEDLATLGETRRREAIAAAAELGVGESSLVFLGYPDAAFDKVHANVDADPTRVAALRDFEAVTRASMASEVYVPDAADEHPDHRATHDFVVEAAKATGAGSKLLTFMVHSGGEEWPGEGPRFESMTIDGVTFPAGVSWPPPVRVPLTPEHSAAKLRALKAHASQWAVDHDYLGRFVKSEEIFWG